MQDSTDVALNTYTLNEDGTSNLVTIILIPYGAEGMHIPTLSTRQIVCSPTIETEKEGQLYKSMRTPGHIFDLHQFLSILPQEQTPEVIIVWADSSLTIFPVNIGAFGNCRKLFMVGDTHHQKSALQNMLIYGATNPFDTIIFMFRQHVHFFRDAGFQNVHWIQGQMTYPRIKTINTERRREIILLGSKGDQHPQRRRIIDELETLDYPLLAGFYPHTKAMELYSEVQISLNVSLNGDMNWRPFEVLGAGGFLVTDRLSHFSGLDILFEEGEHYICFSSLSELKAKLDYYLNNPEECLAIARRGQAHYLKHFSRDRITRAIWERLLYQRSLDIFHVDQNERLSESYSDISQFLPRIAIYETIQECQRTDTRVRVLFLSGAAPILISDCADLPRVEIFVQSDDYQPIAALNPIAKYKPVTYLCIADALPRQWDILVAAHPADTHALAKTFNVKTIIVSDRPWIPNQEPLIHECPSGYSPSNQGFAIFEKQPAIYISSFANDYPEMGQAVVDTALSVGLRDKRVIEIGGYVSEKLAKAAAVKDWIGFSDYAVPSDVDKLAMLSVETMPDYATFQACITDLPTAFDGQFDLVCSFKGMERVAYFQSMLEAAYRALRAGGKLYFTIDPLWSALDGHALPTIIDASGRSFSREDSGIPPWGHLLMDEDELSAHLSEQTDPATVEKIMDHIYRSPCLNRMLAEDYSTCINQVPFKAGLGRAIRNVDVPADILSALMKKYPGYSKFHHSALRYELRK